jgi:hypothetical protein
VVVPLELGGVPFRAGALADGRGRGGLLRLGEAEWCRAAR